MRASIISPQRFALLRAPAKPGLSIVLLAACASSPKLAYPPAQRADTVEQHLGVSVADPYRWLEAMDSPETRTWVAAENAIADGYLKKLPGREALRVRLGKLIGTEQTFPPQHRGSRYFWMHRDGKRDQPTVEVASALDATPSTVIDGNTFGGDAVLSDYTISHDGARIAYGMAAGSGDWQRWRIRDVATGKDLADELADIKYYVPTFVRDGSGVYYSRFPTPPAGQELTAPDKGHRVYFHRIGTPTSEDKLVYERPDQPTWQFEPHISRDGHYLILAIGDGQVGDSSVEQIAYLDLTTADAKVTPLVDNYEAEYVFIGNDGSTMYFETTAHAPNKKIVAVDVRDPAHWRDVIPEAKDAILEVTMAGNQILVSYMRDAHSAVVAYDLAGAKLRELALPGIGSAYVVGADRDDAATSIYFTSFTAPGSVYLVDLATGGLKPWRTPALAFDPVQFETKQVFFASKDGTKIPMFVTAKRGLALDGSHPTLMTGYGWGGVSGTPYFAPEMIAWLERGGVSVLVNIRGGGEYGEAWHLAARRSKRQVQLDDFIAGAEWLIANKWTSRAHLGMFGTSGGGTLVASVLVQRPDLFGAVAPIAGVLDLLRFPLFGQGAGWQTDMGYPDDPTDFPAMRKISPVHNVRAGTHYPPTFVVTSDHDVRVAPLHSYKLAAAMQAAQTGSAPIVLRVQTESGHGGGALQSQQIEQHVELLSFLAANLGLEF
jgi:prolyl oligopeptidase